MIKFIADIGSNHNQDEARTIRLIGTAKEIGCNAVKFQLFKADRLYAPEFSDLREKAKGRELPVEFLQGIHDACRRLDIEFHCTPFDTLAVDRLRPYVDAYKVGSYEVLNLDLITACAEVGKPMSISGGNCDQHELKDAFIQARMRNHRITVFHCAGHYPAPPETCNIPLLLDYASCFENVGWSDHTASPAVIHYAIALGAKTIEFHLDLDDGKGLESEHGHCWRPAEISEVIRDTRRALPALNRHGSYILGGLRSIAFEKNDEIRKWRMDPEDGMRPLKQYREELAG